MDQPGEPRFRGEDLNLLLIIQSDPGYRLPHPGMGPSLRLGARRTYVRNGSTSQVYQAGAGGGYCRVALMGRNSPAPWVQAGRGKPEDGSEVCGPLASQHRPLRSICLPAEPSPPCSNTARSDPGEGIQLSPGPSQTSSVRRGGQETNLRALRSGRDLARRGDFHDPRPRQRGSRRQPPRESQNRLSELRCDAVNPLRPEEPQSATRTFLPSLWEGLQAERPSPSLLLPCMRNPLEPQRQAQTRRAKGNTTSSRSAPSGNRKTWLLGRGQEVRSVRQRDSEVDTRLRAGTCRG